MFGSGYRHKRQPYNFGSTPFGGCLVRRFGCDNSMFYFIRSDLVAACPLFLAITHLTPNNLKTIVV